MEWMHKDSNLVHPVSQDSTGILDLRNTWKLVGRHKERNSKGQRHRRDEQFVLYRRPMMLLSLPPKFLKNPTRCTVFFGGLCNNHFS